MGKAIEALEKPKAKERQPEAGRERGRGKIAQGKIREAKGKVADSVGAALGMSGKTYFAVLENCFLRTHLMTPFARLQKNRLVF